MRLVRRALVVTLAALTLTAAVSAQTLRPGNDPRNVDITEVPLSFNIGLNDHIELFFKTTGYRGVKVNNPKNLSSFYLPNSQLFFGATLLGSPPAIVLGGPVTNLSGFTGQSVFRPAFNQPFVQFPFVGGPAGTFGETGPNGTLRTGCPAS